MRTREQDLLVAQGWTDADFDAYSNYLIAHRMKSFVGENRVDRNAKSLYNAEGTAYKRMGVQQDLNLAGFETIEACRAFANEVQASSVWRTLAMEHGIEPDKLVDVNVMTEAGVGSASQFKKSAGTAHPTRGILLKEKSGYTKFVVLHELAHACGNFNHNEGFRRAAIALYSAFISPVFAGFVRAEYRKRQLGLKQRKTALKSPKQWMKMAKELEAAREAA